MPEFIADVRDIKFALFEQAGFEKLFELEKFKPLELDRETAEAIIDEAYKFAKNQMGPMNAPAEEQGCSFDAKTGAITTPNGFKETYGLYCENGWLGFAFNPEYGGQGMPDSLHLAVNDMHFSSSLAFCLQTLLTTGAAHLIEVYGSDELKQRYIEKMYTGQWAGTMCLTESGAGSDVGASRTKAIPEGDHYLIEGEKIFITFGDHDLTENICHAVLARIEGAPEGSKGLSLFLVPKFRVNDDGSLGEFNDVLCTGIEEKMGIHASPTCTMVFGQNGKCEGYLLGEPNKGMRAMFQMMNEARINVGMQGAALANAAYQLALEYAKERVQGKDIMAGRDPDAKPTTIDHHPDVRQMLMWQKAISEGTRAMLVRTAVFRDFAESADDPAEKERYDDLLGLMTPICKAYCSDQGFRSIELSLQTLGGYGYLKEYGIEQLMRDTKIASIYEGTNGIQALDLIGRKLPHKGGETMKALVGMMMQLIEANKENKTLGEDFGRLGEAVNALVDVSMFFAMEGGNNPIVPVLNATPYLDLFGQVVTGWLLLEQAAIAFPKVMQICEAKGVELGDANAMAKLCNDDEDAKFYYGKIKVAQFWSRRSLPQVAAKAATLKLGDLSPLEVVL